MGLLVRGPGGKKTRKRDDKSMTVIEHLEDLRRALIVCAIVWVICSVVAWFFTSDILQYIEHWANLPPLTYLNPTGAFMLRFKIALYTGTLVASPIIFWQAWWFVGPGLHTHEKRVILPLIGGTSFFFLLGVSSCLYLLPVIMRVLNGFAPHDVLSYLPVGDEFISFLLALCIAFGLVYELPVVLWTLGMLRIISSGWLWRHAIYWVLGLGLVANVLTPGGDPLTPLVLFVPLLVFYGGTTLLLKLTGR
jgi:sec-independent protein translocase protein TatC